jgi:hypothetical protein
MMISATALKSNDIIKPPIDRWGIAFATAGKVNLVGSMNWFSQNRSRIERGFMPLWATDKRGFMPLWATEKRGFMPLWATDNGLVTQG